MRKNDPEQIRNHLKRPSRLFQHHACFATTPIKQISIKNRTHSGDQHSCRKDDQRLFNEWTDGRKQQEFLLSGYVEIGNLIKFR